MRILTKKKVTVPPTAVGNISRSGSNREDLDDDVSSIRH